MKLEKRKLSELKAWENNPRTITEEAYARLKWQITHLEPYKPLLINQDNIVLGGNMRLKAFQELGIKEVDVSVVKTENESKMWEYALSDNDHVGSTDADVLANTMPQLNIDWSKYAVDINNSIVIDALAHLKDITEATPTEGEFEDYLKDNKDKTLVKFLTSSKNADIILNKIKDNRLDEENEGDTLVRLLE